MTNRFRRGSLGVGPFVLLILLAIFLLVITGALYGWLIMLLLGITYHELGWPATPIGFLPCWGIGIILAVLINPRVSVNNG